MSSIQTSYLIVGSGIFGASTALHLRRSKPWANVTIVDRVPYPNPAGASSDLNKIVRADYPDPFYMKLALEAQRFWREEPVFSPWYHESGMCFTADDAGWTSLCYENFRSLGIETGGRMLSHQEARKMFPMFKSADWEGSDAIWYNPQSGWADAGEAMQAILDDAVKDGVIYLMGTVESLLLTPDRTCSGVSLDSGEKIVADTVILCTGARTAKLLADSAPDDHEFQVKDRLIAAAAVQCLVKCDEEYLGFYQNAPVFFNGADQIQGRRLWLSRSHDSVSRS
jgi:sarcosine oxidase / L-pipecolate oxidase